MSLSGNLGSFSLEEVLTLLGHTVKTGALHVRGGEAEGVLYLVEGRLCGAETDRLSGAASAGADLELRLLDAILILGGLDDGAFDFEPERVPPFATTDALEVVPVVERARALRARWSVIQRLVPSLDVPVSLVTRLRTDSITLDRSMWAAVASIDGRRSVRAIAEAVGDSAFELAAALAPLVDAGAVAIGAVERVAVADEVIERGIFAAAVEPFDDVPSVHTTDAADVADVARRVDGADVALGDAPSFAGFDPVEPVTGFADDAHAASAPDQSASDWPVTEGPEALARLNRAELERAALGEPIEPDHLAGSPEPDHLAGAPEQAQSPEHADPAVERHIPALEDGEPFDRLDSAPGTQPDEPPAQERVAGRLGSEDEAEPQPLVPRDRGSLLRMFSALRDG